MTAFPVVIRSTTAMHARRVPTIEAAMQLGRKQYRLGSAYLGIKPAHVAICQLRRALAQIPRT